MPPETDYYARLLRYDGWANTETLGSLRGYDAPAQPLRWMGHIVGSGALWLARLKQEPPAMAVWPDLDLPACAAGVERLADEWPRYLVTFSPDDIEKGVGYRNSLGEDWTSTVGDILTHVAMHGSYHRAQIAAAVRGSGREPAYTDFIHAVRQRFVT